VGLAKPAVNKKQNDDNRMKTNKTNRLALMIAASLMIAPTISHGAEIKSILTTDADGNEFEAEFDKYVEGIVAEFGITNISSESQGTIPAKKAVKYLITTLAEEKELDPEIKAIESLQSALAKIQTDVDRTKANAVSAADKAKKEKEEKDAAKEKEKKEKEEKAAELAKLQGTFVVKVNEGVEKAAEEFRGELEALKSGLPTTMSVNLTGAGAGIALSESATTEDIATGLGYLYGKAEGSRMLGQQLQFMIGDLASAAIDKGIYPDSLAASKAISKHLEEQGKRMSANTIDVYRRLALRTPVEVRNPTVDPTAFLAITQVNPNPKKMDGESDEAFKARKEKLASDLRGLQEELASGAIKTRKEILPKVLEVEYNNRLKERPSGEEKASPGKNLLTFFMASLALDRLDGIHEEGEIHFLGEDGTSVVKVKTEEIEKLKEEALANLLNIYVEGKKVKASDVLRGYSIEEKDVALGADANGKAITEKQPVKTPAYLKVFFPVAKAEDAATGEGAAAEGATDSAEGAKAEGGEAAAPEAAAAPAAEEKKPAAKKAAKSAK
jgi:hypothetical protein